MITVYGREHCVACEYTRKWLERLGHQFDYVDVDDDPTAQRVVAAMGFDHLPIVVTETGTWAGFKLDLIRGI